MVHAAHGSPGPISPARLRLGTAASICPLPAVPGPRPPTPTVRFYEWLSSLKTHEGRKQHPDGHYAIPPQTAQGWNAGNDVHLGFSSQVCCKNENSKLSRSLGLLPAPPAARLVCCCHHPGWPVAFLPGYLRDRVDAACPLSWRHPFLYPERRQQRARCRRGGKAAPPLPALAGGLSSAGTQRGESVTNGASKSPRG